MSSFTELQSMTAAAVAREKAQMYAEFARQREMQAPGLGESELEELETLRLRCIPGSVSILLWRAMDWIMFVEGRVEHACKSAVWDTWFP